MSSQSQPRPIISYPCQVCGTPTSNWCSRCISVWYCSEDHLKQVRPPSAVLALALAFALSLSLSRPPSVYALFTRLSIPYSLIQDWPNHRAYCTPACPSPSSSPSSISPSVPASSAQFSALLFPADEDRPRIVRVSCFAAPRPTKETPITAQNRPCQWAPDVKPWLLEGNPSSVVLTQGLNGEPLRFPLHLFYIPDALAKGTPINRSIFKLTNGLAPRKWSGTVRGSISFESAPLFTLFPSSFHSLLIFLVPRHPSATCSIASIGLSTLPPPSAASIHQSINLIPVPDLISYSFYSRSSPSNTVARAARRTRIAQPTTSRHSCPISCPSHDTCPFPRAPTLGREEACPAQPGHDAFARFSQLLPPPVIRVRSSYTFLQ